VNRTESPERFPFAKKKDPGNFWFVIIGFNVPDPTGIFYCWASCSQTLSLFVFQVEISTDIFIVALSNFTLFSKPL
jgi:hypothetical protein